MKRSHLLIMSCMSEKCVTEVLLSDFELSIGVFIKVCQTFRFHTECKLLNNSQFHMAPLNEYPNLFRFGMHQ